MYAFDKRIQSKCKFLDFQLLAWKLTKFFMSFSSHKSFKLWNTLQCHDTLFLWNVPTETVHALDKKGLSMYNFQTFGCSNESWHNSSCHFWNDKVRVYSNFALQFSVMKNNSSITFFYLKPPILWTKIAHWSEIFELLSGWVKIHQVLPVIFETTCQFFL